MSASVAASLRRPLQHHHIDAWGPPQFTNWVDESMSWKTTCYLADWSFLTTLKYTGPDVFRLFADCSVNSMAKFGIGRSKHIIHTNSQGKIIEEGVLTRTGEQEVIAYSTRYADYVRRHGDYDVTMEPIEQVKYHLQGPNSVFVIEKMLGRQFRDIRFMRNEVVTLAGVETMVLRQGMSGELGFELQAPKAQGRILWDAILEAGREYGIREMGGRVAMINHLEAAYPTQSLDFLSAVFDDELAGYRSEVQERAGDSYFTYYKALAGSFESDDVRDWYRDPVEFGWGNRINFDHAFPGDEALRELLAHPRRRLCTLRWNAEDVVDVYASLFRGGDLPDFMEMPQDPRGYVWSDKILKDGRFVGTTSSRGYSAYFREMISLAVLDVDVAVPDTRVTVVWGNPGSAQREIRAVTAPAPYKQDRARVELHTL